MKVTFPVTQNQNTSQVNFQQFKNLVDRRYVSYIIYDSRKVDSIVKDAARLEQEFGQRCLKQGWDVILGPSQSRNLSNFSLSIESNPIGAKSDFLHTPLFTENLYEEAKTHIMRFVK